MAEESRQLMRDMVSLLREISERQQRDFKKREEISQAIGNPEFATQREESERRLEESKRQMEEMKKQGEKRRQEDMEFREQLLASLRRIAEVFSRIEDKLK